jgi:hypothetical protein
MSSPRFPCRRNPNRLNRHRYRSERPRHHRPDLARQTVGVCVHDPKALRRRNAVRIMVGIPRLRHRGDAFISEFPDRQEIPSHQSSSGETASMQRSRSVSMDVTALKGAPSHPSARRNRTASSAVQGSGHQRVAAKSLSAASSQTAAGRQGGRSRFPFALQSLLPNDFRYAVRS